MKKAHWLKNILVNAAVAAVFTIPCGAVSVQAGQTDCDDLASFMSEGIDIECNDTKIATKISATDNMANLESEMAEGIGFAENKLKAGKDYACRDLSPAHCEEEHLEGISFAEIRLATAASTMPAAGK